METAAITTPEQRQRLLWSINLSLGVVHVVAVAFATTCLRRCASQCAFHCAGA